MNETQDERDRKHDEYMRNSEAFRICHHAINEKYMEILNGWMQQQHRPTFGTVKEVARAARKCIEHEEAAALSVQSWWYK
jgi:hypothetical protein